LKAEIIINEEILKGGFVGQVAEGKKAVTVGSTQHKYPLTSSLSVRE